MSYNKQEMSEIHVSSKIDRTALTETLSYSLKALGITALKWKPNFLNEVKLLDIWSNLLPSIYNFQVLIYLQSIVYHFISTTENKWKKENLQIDLICNHGNPCAHQRKSKDLYKM